MANIKQSVRIIDLHKSVQKEIIKLDHSAQQYILHEFHGFFDKEGGMLDYIAALRASGLTTASEISDFNKEFHFSISSRSGNFVQEISSSFDVFHSHPSDVSVSIVLLTAKYEQDVILEILKRWVIEIEEVYAGDFRDFVKVLEDWGNLSDQPIMWSLEMLESSE